jgi:hypothetical protein
MVTALSIEYPHLKDKAHEALALAEKMGAGGEYTKIVDDDEEEEDGEHEQEHEQEHEEGEHEEEEDEHEH